MVGSHGLSEQLEQYVTQALTYVNYLCSNEDIIQHLKTPIFKYTYIASRSHITNHKEASNSIMINFFTPGGGRKKNRGCELSNAQWIICRYSNKTIAPHIIMTYMIIRISMVKSTYNLLF